MFQLQASWKPNWPNPRRSWSPKTKNWSPCGSWWRRKRPACWTTTRSWWNWREKYSNQHRDYMDLKERHYKCGRSRTRVTAVEKTQSHSAIVHGAAGWAAHAKSHSSRVQRQTQLHRSKMGFAGCQRGRIPIGHWALVRLYWALENTEYFSKNRKVFTLWLIIIWGQHKSNVFLIPSIFRDQHCKQIKF